MEAYVVKLRRCSVGVAREQRGGGGLLKAKTLDSIRAASSNPNTLKMPQERFYPDKGQEFWSRRIQVEQRSNKRVVKYNL
jgi:Txe/YoeB family toxin of Txe-Axe toxin-antitoxin module